jgi:ribosomal protein S18 acetylase RimI-like enzyme
VLSSESGTSSVTIVQADLSDPRHAEDVRRLTAEYATDRMGNGGPLGQDILDRLIPGLRSMPQARIWIAYLSDGPVGLATCFVGFSTFAALPIINVHDLAVSPAHRGLGIGRALLTAVERAAREMGCAKITLEVGDENQPAKGLYEAQGFSHASAGPDAGHALFYVKYL